MSHTDPLSAHPPSLPQKDRANIVERQNMIERRRMLWNFTKNVRLAGYPGTISLPPSFLPLPPSYGPPMDSDMYEYELKLLERKIWGDLNQKLKGIFQRPIRTLDDYAEAIGMLKPVPRLITQNKDNLWGWLTDAEFVRQRLQGLSSEIIELVGRDEWEKRYSEGGATPFNLASVKDEIDTLIKQKGGVDFEEALNTNNIYVCDYTILDSPTLYTLASAFNRYIAAPIAVFYRNPKDRSLHAIAIQLFPGISDKNPVFCADGSMDWFYAKIWVNSIDGQYLEAIPHLYECHLVAEIFQVSMNRQLGTNHPVYQLMHPHFFATLFINDVARKNLLAYDGPINTVISAGVPGVGVAINAYRARGWNFTEKSFINSLKNRGFVTDDNKSQINGYLWEEDGMRLWNTMKTFIKRVLDIFYKTQKDLDDDFEIHEWLNEVESPAGGDLQGVLEKGKPLTVEHLTDILTNLLWTCTAKHSSGNIQQFEYFGFVPNVPGALYTPPPTSRGTVDQETILAALPGLSYTLAQIAIVYLLSDTEARPQLIGQSCGTYPGLDKNPEACAAIEEFRVGLTSLSKDIGVRNGSLTFPYIALDPAHVANSIYI